LPQAACWQFPASRAYSNSGSTTAPLECSKEVAP
jgi:hypothetical protein